VVQRIPTSDATQAQQPQQTNQPQQSAQQPAQTQAQAQQQQPQQQSAPTVAIQQTYTDPPAYPAAQYQDQKTDSGNYDVYIPTGNGSFTLVQLKRSGDGYLGPQGEYYPSYPTVDQLKLRYLK
jgi:hypothetical protein